MARKKNPTGRSFTYSAELVGNSEDYMTVEGKLYRVEAQGDEKVGDVNRNVIGIEEGTARLADIKISRIVKAMLAQQIRETASRVDAEELVPRKFSLEIKAEYKK